MDLSKILSVSGVSGLHKVVAQTKNGVIVESIADGKRFVIQATGKVSALADINIYGNADEIPLKEVFIKIKEKENAGQTSVSAKAADADLKKYFKEVLPDYDQERVYASDIKKVLNWYNLLQSKDLLQVFEAAPENAEPAVEIPTDKSVKAAKTAKAAKTPAPKASKGMAKTQTVRKTGG
jgi:hypothetical protein